MNKYIIYKYTSPSGKSYVGQTKDEERRKRQHQKYHNNRCNAFANAIRKYGFDSFKYEVLERNLTIEQANELEAYYIKEHNALSPNGYNLESGGKNKTLHEETKRKISIARKGKSVGKGRTLTKETKQKMREAKGSRAKINGKVFLSFNEASVYHGMSKGYFKKVIQQQKKDAKFFEQWKIELLNESGEWEPIESKERSVIKRRNGRDRQVIINGKEFENLKEASCYYGKNIAYFSIVLHNRKKYPHRHQEWQIEFI